MVENAEKTTMEELPRSRRRGRVAAGALAVGALVLAAPFASSSVRTGAQVRWLAYRMGSDDRAVREEARRRLLTIGRPAIDPVYLALIAGEVEDEAAGAASIVFVGRATGALAATRTYTCEETLGPEFVALRGWPGTATIPVSGEPECPTALLLKTRGTARELLVVGVETASIAPHKPINHYLLLAVPLDDDLAPAIIEAVKKRLAKKA